MAAPSASNGPMRCLLETRTRPSFLNRPDSCCPMPRHLSVATQLLSLKERFKICEERGDDSEPVELYDCTWRFAWFREVWVLTAADGAETVMRRRILSWVPRWDITSPLGAFTLCQRVFTLRRTLVVEGGPFDGATFTGNFIDMSFRVEHRGQLLATAQGKWLTLRNRHLVELLSDDPAAETLVALLMARLMIDQAAESNSAAANAGG